MSLYAIGDIHGDADNARRAIEPIVSDLTADDAIICLGDVGIRYGDHVNDDLRHYLSTLTCTVLVLRGNHDCRYWRDAMLGDFARGSVETIDWQGNVLMHDHRYPNVLYLPDEGGLITLDGHVCLTIPGAWSIDWKMRKLGGLAFELEEQLTVTERERLLQLAETHPVEFVFSHTCPMEWMSTYLGERLIPAEIMPVTDCTMELWMDDMLDTCDNLQGWWFGHFHDDRDIAFGLGHLLYQRARHVF